jgi:aminopeptidase N
MRIPAIASLLLWTSILFAVEAPEPAPPLSEQYPRARNFDLLKIDAELRLDWKTQRVHGVAHLDLQAFKDADSVLLDAAELDIARIRDREGRALKFSIHPQSIDGALRIELPVRVQAGEAVRLQIDYQSTHRNQSDPNALAGSNGKGVRFLQNSYTEPMRRTQAWAYSESGGVRYWLPGIDQSNERCLVNLRFVLPAHLSVAAVGELVQQSTVKSGVRHWDYTLSDPQPMARIAFAIGEYALVEQATNIAGRAVTLRHFAYPDELQATRESVAQMPAMLAFFSDYTGIPYWRDSYQQVMVQDQAWGVFAPNLAIQTENMVDDWSTHDEYQYLWDHLSAEGLAWQWIGGLLSAREARDEWMLRSLNRYLDSKWDQHSRGTDDEYTLWPNTWDFGTYFADWAAGVRQPAVTRLTHATDLLASNAPLTRGTLALRLLEHHVGEATLQRAIRLFLQRHRGQAVTTEHFFAALEDVSGESWHWFQRQWLEGVAHLKIELSTTFADGVQTVELKQRSALDEPNAALFQGWLDIEIDGELERVWLAPQTLNRYRFERTRKASFVFVDPQRVWMLEYSGAHTAESLRAQIQVSRFAYSRNWAIGELIKLAVANPKLKSTTVDLVLQTGERRELYWRARYAALTQLSAWLTPTNQPEPVVWAPELEARLLALIEREEKWIKAQAILLLGASRNPAHAKLYLKLLEDRYDRVVNAAAFSLGRSKAPEALDALLKLPARPSWKQQSLISALNGLRVLGDPRGIELSVNSLTKFNVSRWTLATPVWDYRQTAAQTLLALGASDAAWPTLERRFNSAYKDQNVLDIFNTLMLASMLELRAAEAWLPALRKRYADDANALQAIEAYQAQFDALKSKTDARPNP